MGVGEIIGMVFIIVMLSAIIIGNIFESITNGPRPSRFHQSLWAESVRERGLSQDEAIKEAKVLGYIKE